MTNTVLLEQIIRDSGLKKKAIAEKMGLSPYGLAKKIDNVTEFTAGEVKTLCAILGITSLQKMQQIFFAGSVAE